MGNEMKPAKVPTKTGAGVAAIGIITTDPSDGKNDEKQKHPGGRPIKDGLVRQQFSLTLDPEFYEKCKIIAKQISGRDGKFPDFVEDAIKEYCVSHEINLDDITVDEKIISKYLEKQEKARNKQKK